ncbi:hypothetical protein vseg_014832 [Gypsophila vaccaria]
MANQNKNVDIKSEVEVVVEEEETIIYKAKQKQVGKKKSNRKRGGQLQAQRVWLEGVVEDDVLPRTKSLTDDDLEELKGCVDLGFGFSYDEIPELCTTLPALELCYSMSHKFLDYQQQQQHCGGSVSLSGLPSDASTSLMPTWKISSPGDHPEDVKARLKFWAQAVACTVKLCSSSSS